MVAGRSIRIGVGLAPHRGSPLVPLQFAAISDNFDDNSLSANLTTGQMADPNATTTGVTVNEVNQRTEVTAPVSTAATRYSGRLTAAAWDITNRGIFIKVGNVASLQTQEIAYLAFGTDASNHYAAVIYSNKIDFQRWVAGGLTTQSVPYSGGIPAWFLLRHDATTDTIRVATALSTASDPPLDGDWVEQAAEARNATAAPLSSTLAFGGGAFGSIAVPTVIQLDGFNTATTAPTTALTGSSTLTFTPTATLLGQGAITGSSTLLLSPAATLTGTGAVSGSSTLTFTPTGTVTGSGAIIGVATLTFAPSGTLLGSGAISGTAALSFAPSGTLLGQGAISGSSSLAFTGSATLAGIGQVAGSATLSFAPTGLLGGTGALTGSAALSFACAVTGVSSVSLWTVQPISQGVWANDNDPVFDGEIFDPLLFGLSGPSWPVSGSTGSWTEQDAVAGIFDGVEFDPAIFDAPGAWSVVQLSTGTWG